MGLVKNRVLWSPVIWALLGGREQEFRASLSCISTLSQRAVRWLSQVPSPKRESLSLDPQHLWPIAEVSVVGEGSLLRARWPPGLARSMSPTSVRDPASKNSRDWKGVSG